MADEPLPSASMISRSSTPENATLCQIRTPKSQSRETLGLCDLHVINSAEARTNKGINGNGKNVNFQTPTKAVEERWADKSLTKSKQQSLHMSTDSVNYRSSPCENPSSANFGSSSEQNQSSSFIIEKRNSDVLGTCTSSDETGTVNIKRVRYASTVASDSDERDEVFGQIYMSLIWSKNQLGIAYYDLNTKEIFLMLDTREDNSFLLLEKIYRQVEPMCVIVCATQDQFLIDMLKAKFLDSNADGEHECDFIKILPTLDFSYVTSKRRAATLNLTGIPEHFSEYERSLYLSSIIPYEKVNVMRALGGLLKYLDKTNCGMELEDSNFGLEILAIHTFSLDDMLIMDDTSYSALGIFKYNSRINRSLNEIDDSLFGPGFYNQYTTKRSYKRDKRPLVFSNEL